MDKLDKIIQEKIRTEYNEIAPDSYKFNVMIDNAKKVYIEEERKEINTYKLRRLSIVAAMFVAIILLANVNSVKAFITQIYEKYFVQVKNDFEKNTKEYTKELNLEYNIEGEKVVISEYVVTNKGVDFKIVKDDNSRVHICACEIRANKQQTYNDMIVDLGDYLIATNTVEDIKFIGQKDIEIALTYYLDDNVENLYTTELTATLDCDKIFNVKTITDENKVIAENDDYKIKNISFYTWYMKVAYEVKKKEDDLILAFGQDDEELTYVSGMITDEGHTSYYQLPKNMNTMEAALINLYNEKPEIDSAVEKIDLKKLLEEGGNE